MIHAIPEKRESAVIRLNGKVLGGVLSAVRIAENKGEGIYELLSEKPVAVIKNTEYRIELTAEGEANRAFLQCGYELSIEDEDKCVRYTGCNTRRLEGCLTPNKRVGYKAVVVAKERIEDDGENGEADRAC